MPRQIKKQVMLLDDDVRRWYENVARGSPLTAETSLRRLCLFCEQNQTSPKALVELGRSNRKAVEDLLFDTGSRMEREGKAPGYIAAVVKGVKSWLRYNDIECRAKIKIANAEATPSIEDERVPTQEELRSILCYASERAKVSISLMAMSGLRPESLGDAAATDGLRLKDLPELKIDAGGVTFAKVPAMVVVRSNLSKARHRYFTFLPSEGCAYLKAYLEKRLAQGESLTSNSPIIAVVPGYEQTGRGRRKNGSQFIATRNVSRDIREALRPRFKWRSYVLRAYFDSQMLLAENQGKISPAYRSFFMGHVGDIEARYTTRKGCLPEQMVESMRTSFEKSEEYLSTITAKAALDLERVKIESILTYAKLSGASQEVLDSIRDATNKSGTNSADKVIELLKEKSATLSSSFTINKTSAELSSSFFVKVKPYQSAIVSQKELVSYVDNGWDVVKEFSDGKFLIKRQNGAH